MSCQNQIFGEGRKSNQKATDEQKNCHKQRYTIPLLILNGAA